MHGDHMDTLSDRTGEPPRTGPSIPHVQLSQNGPKEISDRLAEWITAELPGVRSGPSAISDPPKMRAFLVSVFPDVDLPHDLPDEKATAFFVDGSRPAGVLLMPPTGASEFAHIHPDGTRWSSASRKRSCTPPSGTPLARSRRTRAAASAGAVRVPEPADGVVIDAAGQVGMVDQGRGRSGAEPVEVPRFVSLALRE